MDRKSNLSEWQAGLAGAWQQQAACEVAQIVIMFGKGRRHTIANLLHGASMHSRWEIHEGAAS